MSGKEHRCVIRDIQPLVRVDGDRIGLLPPGYAVGQGWHDRREAAKCRVAVQPERVAFFQGSQRAQIVKNRCC